MQDMTGHGACIRLPSNKHQTNPRRDTNQRFLLLQLLGLADHPADPQRLPHPFHLSKASRRLPDIFLFRAIPSSRASASFPMIIQYNLQVNLLEHAGFACVLVLALVPVLGDTLRHFEG